MIVEEASCKVSWNICCFLLDFSRANMGIHTALKILRNKVDLQHFCGYVTMLNPSSRHANRKLSDASDGRGGLIIIVSFGCVPLISHTITLAKVNKGLNTLIWNSAKHYPTQLGTLFECKSVGSRLAS